MLTPVLEAICKFLIPHSDICSNISQNDSSYGELGTYIQVSKGLASNKSFMIFVLKEEKDIDSPEIKIIKRMEKYIVPGAKNHLINFFIDTYETPKLELSWEYPSKKFRVCSFVLETTTGVFPLHSDNKIDSEFIHSEPFTTVAYFDSMDEVLLAKLKL